MTNSTLNKETANKDQKRESQLPQKQEADGPHEFRKTAETRHDRDELMKTARMITSTLHGFGMNGEIKAVRPGPRSTLYEFKPTLGVSLANIRSLTDDISIALFGQPVRI